MASSFSLSSHLETFIQSQIETGRYGNASEVVRAGLRLLEEHEEGRPLRAMLNEEKLAWLQTEIQKGIDSGPGIPGEVAMARLKARAQTRKISRDKLISEINRLETNEAV